MPDKASGASFKTIIRQEITSDLDKPLHTLHIPGLGAHVEYLFKVRARTSVNWGQYVERRVTTGPQNKEILLTSDQGIVRDG
jgi:hypothetical protein